MRQIRMVRKYPNQLTGAAKKAPRKVEARKTRKYRNFWVVTRHARRREAFFFILKYSAWIHMASWIKLVKAKRKNMEENATW